jgi:hypothetical protein
MSRARNGRVGRLAVHVRHRGTPDAARVVEKRKQCNHFTVGTLGLGYTQSIFEHARPVDDTVVPKDRQRVATQNRTKDRCMIVHVLSSKTHYPAT